MAAPMRTWAQVPAICGSPAAQVWSASAAARKAPSGSAVRNSTDSRKTARLWAGKAHGEPLRSSAVSASAVLTVAQVFELAELVGRRPVGNVRKLDSGGYRLRFRRDGVMRTAPEVFPGRQDAERTLWRLPRMAERTATMTADTAPWSCWPHSRACAGVRSPPSRGAILTWPLRWSMCGPLTPTAVHPAARSRLAR